MRVGFYGRLNSPAGRVVRIDLPFDISLRFAISSIPFPTFVMRRTPSGVTCNGVTIDAGWLFFHVGASRWRCH